MKYKKYAIIIASLAFATFFTGCASNAVNTTLAAPESGWRKEVIDSNNTETHFRAIGFGTSANRNTARATAGNAARSSLAIKVRNIMEVREERSASRITGTVREDENVVQTAQDAEKFNEIAKSVIYELLKSINEYATTDRDAGKGQLEYCIGVEMARKDVADEMLKVIDKDSTIDSAKKESLKAKARALAAKDVK